MIQYSKAVRQPGVQGRSSSRTHIHLRFRRRIGVKARIILVVLLVLVGLLIWWLPQAGIVVLILNGVVAMSLLRQIAGDPGPPRLPGVNGENRSRQSGDRTRRDPFERND